MKSSFIRTFDDNGRGPGEEHKVTNRLVRMHLVDKYELRSEGDIIEFDVREEDGLYERGVYKVNAFGQGEIVVKVIRQTQARAKEYYEDIKDIHHSWQQDSSLGPYILKVNVRSKRPDYDEKLGLLFMEFETAKETLAQRMARKEQYTEQQRVEDYRQLVNAVTYLHKRGNEAGRNFHGDLKPDNIFFVEHRNADGQIVDCLKIGDIEESLGTFPYRDLGAFSLRDWQTGNLVPPGKKDDLMALKMIFLELAYDFCLFDLCDQLLQRGVDEFGDFLGKDAFERKEFIESKRFTKKFFKEFPDSRILVREAVQKILMELVLENQVRDGKIMTTRDKPTKVQQTGIPGKNSNYPGISKLLESDAGWEKIKYYLVPDLIKNLKKRGINSKIASISFDGEKYDPEYFKFTGLSSQVEIRLFGKDLPSERINNVDLWNRLVILDYWNRNFSMNLDDLKSPFQIENIFGTDGDLDRDFFSKEVALTTKLTLKVFKDVKGV